MSNEFIDIHRRLKAIAARVSALEERDPLIASGIAAKARQQPGVAMDYLRLLRKGEAAIALLHEKRWTQPPYQSCICCGWSRGNCNPDCRLDALLK